ncbi:MAG TPA: hypothetical protein VFF21_10135 [Flavobacteriaceae bacterium]|nr:hypothetical protein [Flavobacteriaceae bacterium]
MKKFLFIPFLALGVASCTTLKSGTSKTLDIVGPGVIQMPVVADLEVRSVKVSHTLTYKASNVVAKNNAKSDVVRELLQREKADVLIEPTYESVSTAGNIELTVFGFPATYKNFRIIQKEDIELIEAAPRLLQKAETVHSDILTKKKK